jgi:hypothetical protein
MNFQGRALWEEDEWDPRNEEGAMYEKIYRYHHLHLHITQQHP